MRNVLSIANTAMHRIQSITQQVPTHLKTGMKLAATASDTLRKLMLPRTTESLNQLSMDIMDVTSATLQRFFPVFDFLDEMIEVSVNTHASHLAVSGSMRVREIQTSGDLPDWQINSNNIGSQYLTFANVSTRAPEVYGEAR